MSRSSWPKIKIVRCSYLNPLSDKKSSFVRHAAVVLKRTSKEGRLPVYQFDRMGPEKDILRGFVSKPDIEILNHTDRLMLPAFYDLHFHWVQDEVRLKPKASLLEWLSKYTFPYEAKFKNKNFSRNKAIHFSRELLSVGTIGGACYGSIHGHTVDLALRHFVGDYAVGNVLMTMNSPDYLHQSQTAAIKLAIAKAKSFRERYAVTPRFAISTHPEVMRAVSKLSRQYKSFVQTHLSETLAEIREVLAIYSGMKGFDRARTYTEIYKKCGLLGPRTILGHGIHLHPDEWKLLARTKTVVAHCPTSNAPIKQLGLGSGLFDFKKAERYNVRWGLGSDIGGGPFLSMFDVMRSFVTQNRKKGIDGATYQKALNRSTRVSAEILGLSKTHGALDRNKLANFILVPVPRESKQENAESVLKKLIESGPQSRGDYQDLVLNTFYKGREVFKRN